MMNAAEQIDRARDDYHARRIDRETALDQIRNTGLELTEVGVADLLDHPRSATERYEAAFTPLRRSAREWMGIEVNDRG